MDKLFDLTIYIHNGEHEDGFHIGLFSTREQAESVADRYLREVSGFKDYDCMPRVFEFPVIGAVEHTRQVYRFVGWNTNADFDEVDILVSSCFVDRNEAEMALSQAKEVTQREEWVLNCHIIGQCDWAEGFVRVFD